LGESLLTFLGSIALLLWGMHTLQSGLKRAFGARLRVFLSTALRGRMRAFGAGVLATVALQSSTATSLITAGFVGAGWVALAPALAVVLGAHVGTTLIVQILAFPVTALAPLLTLAAFVLIRRPPAGVLHHVGGMLMGLSLVLLALHQLVTVIGLNAQGAALQFLWNQLSGQPAIALVLAAVLAWAAHSSVAVILLVISLTGEGVIALPIAFALVLGANFGTALNPVFEGAARSDPIARRLPIGSIVLRFLGMAIAFPLLQPLAAAFDRLAVDVPHRVALFHVLFNLVLAVVFMPLLTIYSRHLERWLRVMPEERDPSAPLYLAQAGNEKPVLALARAAREALRIGDGLERMLLGLRRAFDRGEHEYIRDTRSIEDVLDRLSGAIKTHLVALDSRSMDECDHRRVRQILAFTTHLEQAGDLIDLRLLALTSKRVSRGLAFSPEGRAELLELIDRLVVNVRAAATVFMSADVRAARFLAQEKDNFRQLVAAAVDSHFTRLRNGRISSIETSSLHLDMLQVLKQVNSHLAEGAAYPLLECTGALLPSRLRPDDCAMAPGPAC
jgi:phosphate:Na+ symporter